MDDNKITTNDDEFHFSEAEETKLGEYTVASDAPEKKLGKINRRNILIAIGIIIVALSLYKLIGVFFSSDMKKTVQITKTSTVATTAKPQNNSILPSVQIPTQQTSINTGSDLNTQLSDMHQNDVATSQQMAAISDQLSALNATTQNLGNAIDSINQQLSSLSAQIQSTQLSINALQVKQKPKITYHKVHKVPTAKWYVQALVPSRAWLVDANGRTITVAKGDLLPGYGRITYISVIHGIVNTSSGAIIRFGDP